MHSSVKRISECHLGGIKAFGDCQVVSVKITAKNMHLLTLVGAFTMDML